MLQQITGTLSTPANNSTYYIWALAGGPQVLAAVLAAQATGPMASAGTLRKLRVAPLTALTANKTQTFTVQKNGSDTTLTVTINSTTGTDVVVDSTNEVTYAVGDTFTLKRTGANTPEAVSVRFALEFESSTTDQSIGAWGGPGNLMSTGSTSYLGTFAGSEDAFAASSVEIVAVAGSIVKHQINVSAAPGAGKNWVFTLMKNGVAQDGAGGTPDTRITIADAATSGSATFTLSLAAGDRIATRAVPTGTPNAGYGIGTVAFTSSDGAKWNWISSSTQSWSGTSTIYQYPYGENISALNTTEANRQFISPTTQMWLGRMRAAFAVAPGATKSWALTLRKDGADTVQTVTISGTDTSAVYGGTDWVAVASGQLLSLQGVPGNTPGASGVNFISFAATDTNPSTSTSARHGFGSNGRSFVSR
jgi:hypothetical protein